MYYVYILSNWNDKVLYTDMTYNLESRLVEHRIHLIKGFTSRYNVHKLVYFDCTTDVKEAIAKEKQIKGWTRAKKLSLIEQNNPDWHDLSAHWNL
jgi:putative endonuclease